MTLSVTRRFYIQKFINFEKATQFALHFYIYKNSDTLRYMIFIDFFNWLKGGGGLFINKKQSNL